MCIAGKTILEENTTALLFLKDQVDQLFKKIYSIYENILSTSDGSDNVMLQHELASLYISQGKFEVRLQDLHINKPELTFKENCFVNSIAFLCISKAQFVVSHNTSSDASSCNRILWSFSAYKSSRLSYIYTSSSQPVGHGMETF